MEKDLKYLNDLTWTYRASRILQVATGLQIFTYLDNKALSCEKLAALSSTKSDVLEKVLIACTAMGLLKKTGSDYQNSNLSETYLVKGKPLYQGDIISHSAKAWDFWNDLPNDILQQPPRPEDSLDTHRNFILGMHNITVAGRARLFLDNIDLSGRKQLLDVGGGPGTYSILACKKYPELKAIVFDLPETIAIAQAIVKEQGVADRISFSRGSWETDDFGRDNDVVLMSNVLHGSNSQAQMKLLKAYNSLISGGLLVIQEFLLNNSETGPLIPALFNVMVGAYSENELISIIEEAGFSNPKIVAQNEDIGCSWITAEKP
jgi:predicted O-methyltransferase YrrM